MPARLCGPATEDASLAVAGEGARAASAVPPPLAQRSGADDLCVRFALPPRHSRSVGARVMPLDSRKYCSPMTTVVDGVSVSGPDTVRRIDTSSENCGST